MDRWIDLDGTRMHYRVSGGGERAVVIMHGWGCDCKTVASIESVAAESCTVYNVDFPGFGESPEPDEVWGVERYTQAIEKLVEKEGICNPILLGHSFGGRVGILYSSRHPEVDSLILVDAAGIKPKRSLRYYYKVYTFKAAKWALKTLLGEKRSQKYIDSMRAKRGSSDYSGASRKMRSILSRVVNEDLRDRLPLIKAPTLLVWGENDTATPMRDARIMEKEIPDAGLVSFPGCGHYSFLDNPRQFAAVLRSFLQSRIKDK